MSQSYRVAEAGYPYFITSTVLHWISIFSRDDYFKVLVDSFNYCIKNKGLIVHAYVLMPNHFHAVLTQSEGKLSDVVRDMKRHTAKTVGLKLEPDGRLMWLRSFHNAAKTPDGIKLWKDEFHPEQIYSQKFFEQKVDYIHNNPVRAGYVVDPCYWKYSSAGFYYKQEPSVIDVTPIMW
ncbi:MAG TPA: transposase [Armatimonadota bacterium]|jgi:REP element-mobilizing transposase RayT|nr:transposase [Armatimonadota bacterium]